MIVIETSLSDIKNMNTSKLITARFAGTSAMTLNSYYVSEQKKEIVENRNYYQK